LQPELRHEPEPALLGAGFHERIARVAQTRLLVLEVGDGQADEVAGILRDAGYGDVAVTRDLTGTARVVEGRR
jgi:release factor glutamine methyltransferase